MTSILISNLPPLPAGTGSGSPQGTDLIPGTDTTDTTEAASGTTKKYTRAAELNFALTAMGFTTYTAVLAASTTALTAAYSNGVLGVGATLTNSGAQVALTLDGVTLAVGNRVLIKNQAAPAQNGIYVVTAIGTTSANWILTRATDMDEAAEVIQYAVTLVNQGTVSAGFLYEETAAGPFVIGTTSIVFSQFQSGSVSVPVSLGDGGTGAALTASNGGIFYSNASTGAILAGTATASKMLQSGVSSAPAWSSATWPASTTTNQLLYSTTTNTVSGLATAASATLITSAGGVPSLSQTLPSAVQGNITALGTIATGVWNGTIIGSTYGGTGVNNGARTITIGGNVTFSGGFTFAGTLIGNTAVTFPTSGTLATTTSNVGTTVIQTFTTTGAYTPTANMVYCTITVTAAGGGGGSSVGGLGASAGSGGGAGETRVGVFSAATIGASKAVTIGAGGLAGTAAGAGGTGGASSVGALISCVGGSGGAAMGSVSGNGVVSIGGIGGTGGSGGDVVYPGNTGGNGIAAGSSTLATLGSGAGSYYNGAPVSVATGNAGTTAVTPGAGGSGGAAAGASRDGGAGAPGYVTVVEFIVV